jgi:hypothetical protein
MSTRKYCLLAPMSKDVTHAQHPDMQVSPISTSDNKYAKYTEMNLCP